MIYSISKSIILVLLAFFSLQQMTAQTNQMIRGTVKDKWSGKPLAGTYLVLDNGTKGVTTDSAGRFRMGNIQAGRHYLSCFLTGYSTWVSPDLWIESGKETVLDIILEELHTDLPEIVLNGESLPRQSIGQLNLLSQEMTLRYPATFYDPARLASAMPGVTNDNDQANGLIIRNFSPNGVNWRLWGAEIINPNHTANAGTFSDRVTGNAGGVSMISMQLLDNTAFYSGLPPVSYGNAGSGTLDMSLRSGNTENREYTIQAGLIGIDLATEGPLGKAGSGASYLVNYRYSTIGLLQRMGLELGDEAIEFQDLSMNLSLPLKKGSLQLFGILGSSSNRFSGSEDSTSWTSEKDPFSIDFTSSNRIFGARYLNGALSSTWVYSSGQFLREASPLVSNHPIFSSSYDYWQPEKLSGDTRFTKTLNGNIDFLTGLNLTYNKQIRTLTEAAFSNDGVMSGLQIAPYIGFQYQKGKWQSTLGIHSLYFTWNNSFSAEPRLELTRKLSKQTSMSFTLGKSSQLQSVQVYIGTGYDQNKNLDFTKLWQGSLTFKKVRNTEVWSAQFYGSLINKVPISANAANAFSALNVLEEIINFPLVSEGRAFQFGTSLQNRVYWKNGFYSLINFNIGQLKYLGSDNIWREGRFNHQYLLNATVGKEWSGTERKGKLRQFGINARFVARGGFREMSIDLDASKTVGNSVFSMKNGFDQALDDYVRLDLRIYRKWNAARRSNMLSLDIQNASNENHIVYNYYDRVQQKILGKKQLGIIPILSYRVNFTTKK